MEKSGDRLSDCASLMEPIGLSFKQEGKNKVFFIDEIQNVNNFENFIRRFYDDGIKFFISGSNANLLSSEIATKLTGRHIDTRLTPFSFTEFLTFSNIKYSGKDFYKSEKKAEIINAFNIYLKNGGMPEYIKYNDKEILTRTYNDIVLKDIVVRYKLENILQLKMLYSYIVNNYARRYSYNSLRKIVNLGSSNTIINYLNYLEQTFFIKQLVKFDYSIKKQIANEKKSYIVDNGFITSLSVVLNKDEGWLLENLVFNELIKSNDAVYYYSDKNECDFLTINNAKPDQAIQVTSAINQSNQDREINGLLEAMNKLNINYGIVLSKETEKTVKINKNELSIIPIWKWLLQKKQKTI